MIAGFNSVEGGDFYFNGERINDKDPAKVQHLGTSKDIYQRPANLFVSTFIGRSNILKAEMKDGKLLVKDAEFQYDAWKQIPDGPMNVSIRPEKFLIHSEQVYGVPGKVADTIYLGMDTHYVVKLSGGEEVQIIQESTLGDNYHVGESVWLTINTSKINIFTADGLKNYFRD